MKVTLTVYYETPGIKGSNDFRNLQELKRWLEKHPDMAKELGYQKPTPSRDRNK
jgi:hypothetical protein